MGPHEGTISVSVNGYEAEKHGEAVRINIRGKALAAQYLLPSEPDHDNEKRCLKRSNMTASSGGNPTTTFFVDVTSLLELSCVL